MDERITTVATDPHKNLHHVPTHCVCVCVCVQVANTSKLNSHKRFETRNQMSIPSLSSIITVLSTLQFTPQHGLEKHAFYRDQNSMLHIVYAVIIITLCRAYRLLPSAIAVYFSKIIQDLVLLLRS
jgi:hypothetical protein